jgi:hypothetical protein
LSRAEPVPCALSEKGGDVEAPQSKARFLANVSLLVEKDLMINFKNHVRGY